MYFKMYFIFVLKYDGVKLIAKLILRVQYNWSLSNNSLTKVSSVSFYMVDRSAALFLILCPVCHL